MLPVILERTIWTGLNRFLGMFDQVETWWPEIES